MGKTTLSASEISEAVASILKKNGLTMADLKKADEKTQKAVLSQAKTLARSKKWGKINRQETKALTTAFFANNKKS